MTKRYADIPPGGRKDDTDEKRLARLEKLRKVPKEHQKQEVDELPRWFKVAVARKELTGETWKEIAEQTGKSQRTLERYMLSPAAKKWRATFTSIVDDPVTLAREILKSQVVSFSLDYLALLDAAIEARDRDLAEKMLSKLMESEGIISRGKSDSKPSAVLVFKIGDGAEEVRVESDVVVEGEYEVEP